MANESQAVQTLFEDYSNTLVVGAGFVVEQGIFQLFVTLRVLLSAGDIL